MIHTYLSKLIEGASLTRSEANEAMNSIMSGETPSTQIAAFLVAMRMKGENSEEVTGFVESMRSNATPVTSDAEPIIDMCGTGGDGAGTFNISTIASLVVAAGGITVAKHGNRAVSSKCGSADLFSALGVNIEMPVERLSDCLNGCPLIRHSGHPLFDQVSNPFKATRYHSLIVEDSNLPEELDPIATAEDGTLMAVAHKEYPIFGLQFHPESVFTNVGMHILDNFLKIVLKNNSGS